MSAPKGTGRRGTVVALPGAAAAPPLAEPPPRRRFALALDAPAAASLEQLRTLYRERVGARFTPAQMFEYVVRMGLLAQAAQPFILQRELAARRLPPVTAAEMLAIARQRSRDPLREVREMGLEYDGEPAVPTGPRAVAPPPPPRPKGRPRR